MIDFSCAESLFFILFFRRKGWLKAVQSKMRMWVIQSEDDRVPCETTTTSTSKKWRNWNQENETERQITRKSIANGKNQRKRHEDSLVRVSLDSCPLFDPETRSQRYKEKTQWMGMREGIRVKLGGNQENKRKRFSLIDFVADERMKSDLFRSSWRIKGMHCRLQGSNESLIEWEIMMKQNERWEVQDEEREEEATLGMGKRKRDLSWFFRWRMKRKREGKREGEREG